MKFSVRSALALSGLLVAPVLNSCAKAAPQTQAPAVPQPKRPNIMLILADDMGYSDIGCYGGDIDTPNIDKLASEGIRFTHFYNAARCCPTRASLMTGLYPAQAGIGDMNYDLGLEAYQGELNKNCVTLAEVLHGAGYSTYMTGKWHLTTFAHNTATTEQGKANWPRQRGFDHYYGVIAGQANYFHPATLTLENQRLAPPADNFYTTDAFSDYAVKEINEHDKTKPFFFYVAYNAPHWPLNAKPQDLAKYKGRFDQGWDVLREARYKRQIQMGLVDAKWPLTTHAQAWTDEPNKPDLIHKMETYAAMVDSMDQGIGRIVAALKKNGEYDNTLLIFLSDNGACHEEAGYGVPWANLSNTPYRLYKHWTAEGGIATPLIVHWPDRFKGHGEWNRQIGDIKDLMATFVDVSGAKYPTTYNGHPIPPMEGQSLLPAFGNKPLQRAPLFWEHEGNRAVVEGDWKLLNTGSWQKAPHWELYNLAQDRTETHDLAATEPARVQQMAQQWTTWAKRTHVLPFPTKNGDGGDDDGPAPTNSNAPATPQIAGKELVITCDVTPDSPNANGVILAQGGNQQGYALYLVAGKPIFGVRENGQLYSASAPDAPTGKFSVEAHLQTDGSLTLALNGTHVALGKAPGPIPVQPKDDLSIGQDIKGAVGTYQSPNPLQAKIENVKITAQ